MNESIQVLLAINEQGADEARAKIQGVERALSSLQSSQRASTATPDSTIGRLQTGLLAQKTALQDELAARSAVADKASLVASTEGRRAAQEKLTLELQANATAAKGAAERKAAEIEYIGLLAQQKASLLDAAKLRYGVEKTPENKQIVTDATNALAAEKTRLGVLQGERAALVQSSQLYSNQAKNSRDLTNERAREVQAAKDALTIEQQRLLVAQQSVDSATKLVNKLQAQADAEAKSWSAATFKQRQAEGAWRVGLLPANATRPNRGVESIYAAKGMSRLGVGNTGAGDDYVGSMTRHLAEYDAQLKNTEKTGKSTMDKTGAAASKTNVAMRNLAVGARSVGSVLAGTSFQGGLYYMSQIGRVLTGDALVWGGIALGVAAVASAFGKLVQRGVEIETVSKAFANLTANVGIAGEALGTKLQAGSKYVLSLTDSMTIANRALLAGGEQFATKLPQLLEIARSAALASGQDISYTFNSLVTGIARGSPKLIDNADIYLRLGDATAEYAKQLGKSVTELTAAERQQATLNAVLKQGGDFTNKVGLQTKTAAEKYKSAAIGIRDYIDALALLTTEKTNIEDIFESIGVFFENAATGVRQWASSSSDDFETYNKSVATVKSAVKESTAAYVAWQRAIKLQELHLASQATVDYYQALYVEAQAQQNAAGAALLHAKAIYDVEAAVKAGKYNDIPLGVAGAGGIASKVDQANEAKTAIEAFNTKLAEGGASGLGQKAQLEGLAESVIEIRKAAEGLPEMPKFGSLVLSSDVANLRAWVNTLREMGVPEQVLAELSSAVDRLESSKPTLAEIDKLLSDMQTKRAQPITGADFESGIAGAVKGLDDLAQKATEVGAYDLASKLRGAADDLLSERGQFWSEVIGLDAAGFQNWLNEQTRGTEKIAQKEIDRRTQLIEFQDKLAEIASSPGPSLKGVTTNLPEIGTALFSTDLTAIDAYYAKLVALEPANADLINATRASIAELQKQKDTLLAAALAADDPIAALRTLTQQEYGASTGLIELIGNLENIPGAAVGSANGIRIFGAALDEIIARMREPISLSAMVESIQSGAEAIQASALDLAKYIGPEKALTTSRDLVDRYMADVRALGKRETAYDKDEWDIRRRYIEDYYTDIANSGASYYEGLKSKSKDATASLKRDAGEVQSAIEAALMKGREVTPADQLATKAGTYEDKPLENARRLDAIAERGFAELKAHPDWAGILGIPPDIMGGTEDQLKAWAAQTAENVDNLLRPDLINWDAFIANYKQGLQDEATKKLTLDIALGKLKTAGLLEGKTDKEARAEVLKMLGLEEPKVTFDSYFNDATSDDPASLAWMNYERTKKPAQMQVGLVYTTGEDHAALVDEKTTGATTSKDVAGAQATDALLSAMNKTGKDIAGAMYTSLEEAVKAQTPSILVAEWWGKDFEKNIGLFAGMGTMAGNQVGDSFIKAIETKTGKVRETLAKAVAGELLPELDRRYVRKGTPD